MPIKVQLTAQSSLTIRSANAGGFDSKYGPCPERHADSKRLRRISGLGLDNRILALVRGR